MRNIKSLVGLWRDDVMHLLIYAILLAGASLWMVEVLWLKHAREQTMVLSRQVMLKRENLQDKRMTQSPPETQCAWHKRELAWKITGHFGSVYNCVLNGLSDDMPVASIQFKQHVLGVVASIHKVNEPHT
jgi:hypothetical protein